MAIPAQPSAHLRIIVALLAAITLVAISAHRAQAAEPETVRITSDVAQLGPFTALLFRPKGKGPFPAVVALHGCGGLFNDDKEIKGREEDWAERLAAAGYVALLPDSFTARGVRQIARGRTARSLPPSAEDAAAAAGWLAKQPFVDASRMGLMAGRTRRDCAVDRAQRLMQGPQYKVRSALPRLQEDREACRLASGVPHSALAKTTTDRAGPCRKLARREGFRTVTYPMPTTASIFDAPETREVPPSRKARRMSAPTRRARSGDCRGEAHLRGPIRVPRALPQAVLPRPKPLV